MQINYNDKPIKSFLAYIYRHRKLFYIDIACALLVAAIDLVFPYVSRAAMRRYLPEGRYTVFFLVMGIMVLAYVLGLPFGVLMARKKDKLAEACKPILS